MPSDDPLMIYDAKLQDEVGRLAALHRYEVLDTPPDEPFDKITSLVQTILDVPMCAVSLIDKDRQWFKSRVGLDMRETSRDASFCNLAIRTRQPMAVEDAMRDPRFAANPLVTGKPFIRSYLGVPLQTPDGYNIGTLCVLDTVPRVFDSRQIEVLTSFASVVVDELELLSLVRTDQLTGAASRRAFVGSLAKAAARFARHRRAGALVLMDLDHFKRINDTFGHPAGDTVLRAIGRRCNDLIRAEDTFGRLGGEEFGFLLADTTLQGAVDSANRFREAIAALSIPHDPPLRITASFGISTFSDDCDTVDALFAKSDRGVYLAKQAGRNCCCCDPDHPADPPGA